MNSNGLIEILTHLRSTAFRDVAGTRIVADVPVSARLINDIVAASLPPGAPVREVSINPEAGDRFSVRIAPRASLLPQLTLRLEIDRQPDFRHAGIDIFLSAGFQGRGLGPDAVRTVARHMIDDRGHHRLTIDPAADNAYAIRCYEKVGFRRVGVMREYWRDPDGVWRDGLLLDLLAKELT